ncbi:MAG TPA: alcohol dehydrogenase catalytic domain-containing protein [Armatimonadota bacterium]|nr:alcohol dehydrogenase catalytic domain-containing protein [Armatimonadota bacterium]
MPTIEDYRAGTMPLPDKNLAWQLTGTGLENFGINGTVSELPLEAPKAGELLCRIDAAGLCFSDIKVLTLGADHPRIAGRDLVADPVVMGHEVAITVVKIGEGLEGDYSIGDRFVVQADIYYKGEGLAFGYALAGALQQYVTIGKEIIDGDDGSYIIPVSDATGDAESALCEPWACVECSYGATHRTTLKEGGTAMIVALGGGDCSDLTLGRLAEGPWPAKAVVAGLPDGLKDVIAANVGEVEQVACQACALGTGYEYDDIILIGDHEAETVEAAGKALAKSGILCQIRSTPLSRSVEIDVGRIHYDDTHYLGATGPDVAAGYASRNSDIRSGGKTWYIGAGGPMGQMHVQRACEDATGPALALCTDVDNDRLGTIPARYGAAAEETGTNLLCINPTEMSPDEFNAKADELAPEGFDDIVVLAPVAVLISGAMDKMGQDGVLNIFAGLARGTMATLDMSGTFLKGVRLTGTSGSSIQDFEFTLGKTERKELGPNGSVAAIGGLSSAKDGLQAVKDGAFAGKVIIYTQIEELALTALEDLNNVLPDVAAKLGPRDAWTNEAEVALIEHFLRG